MWVLTLSLVLGLTATLVPVTMNEGELFGFLQEMSHNSKKVVLHRLKDGGYRWVATAPIHKGEPIVGLPLTLCITTFDTFPLTEHLTGLKPDLVLTVRIMYEKFMNAKGGFSNRYVHSLPVNLTQLSIWPDDKKDNLNYEINYALKVQFPTDMTNGYYVMKKRLKDIVPAEMLDWDVWCWAFVTAQVRAFQLDKYSWLRANGYPAGESDQQEFGGALYPMVDLAPHQPLPLRYRHEQHRAIVMQEGKMPGPVLLADREFKAKQVVGFHYRNLTNYELLYIHGSVVEKNVDDVFEVNGGEDPKCPEILRKGECWFALKPTELNFKLLNWLRLLHNTKIAKATPTNIFTLYPVPRLNETQASFTGALVLYRLMVTDRMDKSSSVSLRSQVRALQLVNETYYQLSVRLGLSQKRTMHEHLKLFDRQFLKLLVSVLGLHLG